MRGGATETVEPANRWLLRGFSTGVAGLAALLTALGMYAVQQELLSSQRAGDHDRNVSALDRARALTTDRQRRAGEAAASLSGSAVVQSAFARRDPAPLAAIVARRPSVSFTLWNGRTLGRSGPPGLSPFIGIYDHEGLIGRVAVDAEPDSALLSSARGQGQVRIVYAIGRRAITASPPGSVSVLAHSLAAPGSAAMVLSNTAGAPKAYLYAAALDPARAFANAWILVAAALAGLAAYAVSLRHARRRAPRSSAIAIGGAAAIVGETLAATHKVEALLPVILRTALDATGARGGYIVVDGERVLVRGSADANHGSINIDLDTQGESATTMTLVAPPGGFDRAARDAAAWIGSQAVIALENAHLHGLVQRQAVTDELTGLANRRQFRARLELEIERSKRNGTPLSLLIADLDDFKRVNDEHGHDAGDEALRAFASTLQRVARQVDLPVRLGGEEFALLLPETALADAVTVAERLRSTLEANRVVAPRSTFALTASIGVSCFPETAGGEDLLVEADHCLYAAKRSGKNRVAASRSGHARVA